MSNARRYDYVIEWRLEKRDGRWIIDHHGQQSLDLIQRLGVAAA